MITLPAKIFALVNPSTSVSSFVATLYVLSASLTKLILVVLSAAYNSNSAPVNCSFCAFSFTKLNLNVYVYV